MKLNTIMKLTSINLKPEFRGKKLRAVHISHFTLQDSYIKMVHRIEYIDNDGYIHVLKDRGCIKPKKFKQITRRKLKLRR